ncbi:hypothetical protein FQN60_016277, partial [Etheostoma spectabile]
MIVSNVSLSGCAGVNSALCAAAAEGHFEGGSHRTTLTPTGNLIVAVCLGFIGIFGFMNNLLVLVLYCRYKMLRSPINLLLINIAISDLLVCVLGTPFSFAASMQGRWLIGEGGCVWYGFANSLFGIVSLISLAVLSYERYSTMVAPTEADSSNYRNISLGITLSWVYSLIWTMPPLFGWSHYGLEGPGTTCSVNWTAKTANNISYIICLFVFCLIVPFLVIVFCYGKLLCAIRQVRKYGDGEGFHLTSNTCTKPRCSFNIGCCVKGCTWLCGTEAELERGREMKISRGSEGGRHERKIRRGGRGEQQTVTAGVHILCWPTSNALTLHWSG